MQMEIPVKTMPGELLSVFIIKWSHSTINFNDIILYPEGIKHSKGLYIT